MFDPLALTHLNGVPDHNSSDKISYLRLRGFC